MVKAAIHWDGQGFPVRSDGGADEGLQSLHWYVGESEHDDEGLHAPRNAFSNSEDSGDEKKDGDLDTVRGRDVDDGACI